MIRSYVPSSPQIDPKRPFMACAADLSPTRLFHANRFTFRNTLAIPIRAEACRLMNGRKSHEKESGNANQDDGEQNAHHVSARRIPPGPSHLSIQAASLIGKVPIDPKHAERIRRPKHPFGRGFSRASEAYRQNDTDDWRLPLRRKFWARSGNGRSSRKVLAVL